MLRCILSTDERGSSWRRLCRCWLHQGLPWWQPLVRPAAMESLPWRQPFLSVIECMCDLLMYWMYILSYIVLSQKWLNKDDQTTWSSFPIISQQGCETFGWNHSSLKTRICLSCMVNIMYDDNLGPILLTWITCKPTWISNHTPSNVRDELSSVPKLQRLQRWSLWMP